MQSCTLCKCCSELFFCPNPNKPGRKLTEPNRTRHAGILLHFVSEPDARPDGNIIVRHTGPGIPTQLNYNKCQRCFLSSRLATTLPHLFHCTVQTLYVWAYFCFSVLNSPVNSWWKKDWLNTGTRLHRRNEEHMLKLFLMYSRCVCSLTCSVKPEQHKVSQSLSCDFKTLKPPSVPLFEEQSSDQEL